MLQLLKVIGIKHSLRDSDLIGDAIRTDGLTAVHLVEEVHGTVRDLDSRHLHPRLWLDQFPVLRSVDILEPVENSKTVFVTEQATRSGFFPVRVLGVNDLRSFNT